MVLGLSTRLENRISPLSKRGSWPFRAGLGQFLTGTSKVPEVDQKEAEMETDRLGLRKAPGERAELRERQRRPVLVVEPDRRRSEGFRVVRGQPRSRAELPFGGNRPQSLLVGGTAQQVRLDGTGRADEARDEGWKAGRARGMSQVLRPDGRRRVRLNLLRLSPGARSVGLLAREGK